MCASWARAAANLRRADNRPIRLRGLNRLHRKWPNEGDVIMKSGLVALCCAAAVGVGVALSAAPASAQNRLKTCNDEWNAMKANNTVGDKKYADFRKECLARTAATPAAAEPATPAAPPAAATTPPLTPEASHGASQDTPPAPAPVAPPPAESPSPAPPA